MDKLKQTNKTPHKDEALTSNKKKNPWMRPTLIFLGKVRDFVKGGGKSAINLDHDPGGTRKRGVG